MLPLLHGQKESSPTRQNIMSRNTRSRGPVADENLDPVLASNQPTVDKIPRKATGASTRHREEKGKGGAGNLDEDDPKMTKQQEARFQKSEMEKYIAGFRDKDASKPELVTTIVELRKENFIQHRRLIRFTGSNERLEHDVANLQSKHTKLLERLESIQEEHEHERADLEAKLAKAIADKQKSRMSGNIIEKNNALKKKIIEQSKGFLWGMVKFIQSAEEEEGACKLLLKMGHFEKKFVDTKQKRMDVVETYKKFCKKAIFLRRNYATAETKKMIMRRYQNNEEVLSLDDLIMCLQRNIVTEEDMKKFIVYWEEYLPKFVGSMEWSEKVRNYVTICRAMRKDNPILPLITPDDEAFGVLCVHNGMARWEKEYKKLKAEANGDEVVQNDDEDDKKRGQYDGIFTKTTQGQNWWGGWIPEGLEKFIEYRAMNVLARKQTNTDKVEKDCLYNLRMKNGIEENCESATEHLKNKEAKKRMKKRGLENEALPPKKKVVHTLIYSSNSSDEDEE